MASTITIQQTITNFVLPFIVQRPFIGVGGATLDPGLTAANYLMQSIMQPPFRWEWNRLVISAAITTVAGQSDYPTSIPTFGWLENATLVNPSPAANTPPNFQLELCQILSKDGQQNRPQKLALLTDNGTGTITFRLFPVPDAVYTVDLDIQNAPLLATTLSAPATTWAPIPDKLAFLYERGMIAIAQSMYNQQLGLSNLEIFFRQLVGAAAGLSEMERAIFLEDELRPIRMRQNELQAAQQGKQARQ
jgi:hypothetical protein